MADQPSQETAATDGKSTGGLKLPTGSLPPAKPPPQFSRALVLRAGETAIFLVAMIGAVALGLGITAYFRDHRYVFAYLLAYAGFRFADLLVREESEHSAVRDELASRIATQLPLLVLFAGAPFERTYVYGGAAPGWLAALGLLLELLGLWLALGARMQLLFFGVGKTAERPILVTGGFFRHVRHPVYAGVFLVLLAWPMEYGAPIVGLVMLIVGLAVAQRRIKSEEAEMRARFGAEYENYMRTTDALIPSVW